jgi:predicted DNA-binding transcriptional regulator AlpA
MPRAAVSKKRRERAKKAPPTALFNITSFCLAHGISESFFYELRKQGLGPRELKLGSRVFITHESASEWRAQREAATAPAAA